MTTILFFAVVSQVTEMLRFCRTAVELKDTLLMVKIYVSVEADPMMHVAAMINLIMFKKQLNTILRFWEKQQQSFNMCYNLWTSP